MTSTTDPTPDPAADEHPSGDPPPPARPTRRYHPLLLLGAVVAVAVLALGVRAAEPAEPDGFYTPPSALPTGGPGTIIRSERLATAPAGSRGWRILYESTDPDGRAIAVSGVVFAPTAPAAAGSRPIVAWAHPTTGVDPRCAPSIGGDGGAGSVAGLAPLLAAGYVVTATDYPGLGTPGPHPYLVGESEARAVLDSIRAAGRLDGTEAGTSAALWGHSQGGHAVLFAGQAAPTYAPELDVVGVAAAAPATMLADLLRRDIGGVTGNVLASMALVAWSAVYADQGATLASVAEPNAVPMIDLIADHCVETTTQNLIELPAAEVLQVGFLDADPWSVAPWDTVLAENTPGAVALRAPLLVTQGTADSVVWPGVTDAWVAGQCRAGVVIDERRYEGRTHTEIATASAADVQDWIADRFAGRTARSTCATPPR